MQSGTMNGSLATFGEYETPFADAISNQRELTGEADQFTLYGKEFESPFLQTYMPTNGMSSPQAENMVQLLAELNSDEFGESLYEMASELEDSWNNRITSEVAMGDRFVPFATQRASEYFYPVVKASERLIDTVSQQFSGRGREVSDYEVEQFFETLDTPRLSPAQEQFLGGLVNKVKSVVKKGLSVVGKILPVNIILNKLKGLIKPLLDRVLKFAIGKLPKNLQPYAQTLASKFLKLQTGQSEFENPFPSGEVDAIQTEFDSNISNLVYSEYESEADGLIHEYEASAQDEGGDDTSLQAARENLIRELKELEAGDSPAPAIERFLPIVLGPLGPIVKMGITVVGRGKIINFLAGLLAKLIGKYVPENVAKPLAASIIDTGMSAIGFETYEVDRSDVAYEALTNTIEETVQGLDKLNEATLADRDALTLNLLEAFETAAANNFPPQYLREDLKTGKKGGVWVLKPRKGSRHLYKKYSRLLTVTLDPAMIKEIKTYRDLPLHNFLKDKLGLDVTKSIQARVHLYEAIDGTRLSQIGKSETLPGLSASQPHSWRQLLPLTKQAAASLLNDVSLGKDLPAGSTAKRTRITTGQRFYYLEIAGAKLKMNHIAQKNHSSNGSGTAGSNKPVRSGDVRAVINFVKSSISLNYYISEEDARSIVVKLNQNDFVGTASVIKSAIQDVLKDILLKNVTSKVKIIHEAYPEMFLENYPEQELGDLLGPGKAIIKVLIEKLIDKISGGAFDQIKDHFKARGDEFKNAQAQPEDGVTISIIWSNVSGMSVLKTLMSAIRGNLSLGSLSNLSVPSLSKPEITIKAGKHFE